MPVPPVPAGEEGGGLEPFQASLKSRNRRRMRRRGRRMMIMSRRWRGRRSKVYWRTVWWWWRACWSNSPWSRLPLVSFTCNSCFKVLFTKKKLNNHIVKIHKDPTTLIIWGLLRHQITYHLSPFPVCQNNATTVARTSKKNSLSKHMLVVHGASRF